MAARELSIDVLIFGGGIAGLWTLARLRREGYSCVLVEREALGSGQTVASQGIIHGGIKYALSGRATAASRAIADMPAIWRACLRGDGEIDLSRRAAVLSTCQALWTTGGWLSRTFGFGASRAVRSDVVRRAHDEGLDTFPWTVRGGDVYLVDEPVLDMHRVLELLRDLSPGCIVTGAGDTAASIEQDARGIAVTVRDVRVRARTAILAAGAGNAALMERLGVSALARQQARPLHMVMVRNAPVPVFGHAIGISSLPRLTITSSESRLLSGNHIVNGRWAGPPVTWYIGGEIAEAAGVKRSPREQIEVCRAELAQCIPGADLSRSQFATFRVDRIEGLPPGAPPGERPEQPCVLRSGNVIVAWPTKLAFAPLMARHIMQEVRGIGLTPEGAADASPFSSEDKATVDRGPWEHQEVSWT